MRVLDIFGGGEIDLAITPLSYTSFSIFNDLLLELVSAEVEKKAEEGEGQR